VTDAVRDNHVRFIGGVWLGLGLIMPAGGVAFQQLRSVLVAFSAMICIGGLARFSAGDESVLTGTDIAPSLVFEIIAMPLLGFWISKLERRTSG